jgi:hypothetical protein
VSTDLVVTAPTGLVDPRTGEFLEPTPANALTLLDAARDMRARLMDLVKDCELVLLEESRRQGTKTLHVDGVGTAEITGGSELSWDLETLLELRDLGLPEDRYDELVVATVTYKVDARVAKQLEGANPDYAAVIERARTRVEKPWRVRTKA